MNIYTYKLKYNEQIRNLLKLINSHFKIDLFNMSIQEVNMKHVINNISNKEVKCLVKSIWLDLEAIHKAPIHLLISKDKRKKVVPFLKRKTKLDLILKL